ncbi:MAG: carbohydrate kinase [Rhodovulum sulfidophilum]|uniref:Carbohydrate kinase n=1 Tax=Rhodovulum sulfidophilum TaxID=35806 RepID=A0A2W5PUS0_RHOSU|nr:MAG: carbohydrate kinase [Rhodovulum sulfidophilum]
MIVEFATFGSLGIDDLVFPDGSTMWGVPGGGSMYSAMGMAIWGGRPSVVAPVGDAYPFEAFRDRIDFSRCPRIDRTMRNWGLYEEDGTRHFTLRSTCRDYETFCAAPEAIGDAVFGGVHISAMPWAIQNDVARALRAAGVRHLSIDADDKYSDRMSRDDIAGLLTLADLFVPSWQDVRNMLPGRSPEDGLRELREIGAGVPVIAVKMGAEGALLHVAGDDRIVSIPTAAEVVVDVTGAGDAFAGGALLGYARTGDAVEAMVRGSVSASFALAAHGPAALLSATPDEIHRRAAALRGKITATPF